MSFSLPNLAQSALHIITPGRPVTSITYLAHWGFRLLPLTRFNVPRVSQLSIIVMYYHYQVSIYVWLNRGTIVFTRSLRGTLFWGAHWLTRDSNPRSCGSPMRSPISRILIYFVTTHNVGKTDSYVRLITYSYVSKLVGINFQGIDRNSHASSQTRMNCLQFSQTRFLLRLSCQMATCL